MAPLGIAIVGSGIFVREQHLPAVLAIPELLELKAIWSRSLSSAQEAAKLIPQASQRDAVDLYSSQDGLGRGSIDDMLQRSDIVGIILALPIPDMPAYIEKCLAAGKHVLGEKPIAPTVARAWELVDFAKKNTADSKATWAVAENFRFIAAYHDARKEILTLGNITSFHVSVCFKLDKSNKYYGTAWRANPEFQGGFILDAGVHFTAALRVLLGDEHTIQSLSAHTSQVSDFLPPLDTLCAVLKTKSGLIGSFHQSLASAAPSFQFRIVCENGFVEAERSKVVVVRGSGADAQREVKEYTPTMGVEPEVKAWAEGLAAGKQNPLQAPEQAIADLELMEKMFRSGEQDGAAQRTEHQF